MAKPRPYLIPLLLFFISFIPRLLLLSQGPFHLDALNLAIQSAETLRTHQLHFLFGSGYPLTVLLGTLFVWLSSLAGVDDPVRSVNLMSAFFGAFSTIALYMVGLKFFDRKTALLSALLFSLNPLVLTLSTYGMGHMPALFFLLATIYFLSDPADVRRLLIAGFLSGLVGASRIQDWLLMLAPLATLFFRPSGPANGPGGRSPREFLLRAFFIFTGLSGIVLFILHLPYIFQGPGYTGQVGTFFQLAITENIRSIFSYSMLVAGKYVVQILSWPGTIVALAGMYLFSRENRHFARFLGLWIIVPFLFYGSLYTLSTRFLVIVLAPLALLQGYCLARLFSYGRIFRLSALLALGTISCVNLATVSPLLAFRHQHAPMSDFARWVGQVTEPDARVIAVDHCLFLQHYARRPCLYRPCNYFDNPQEALAQFRASLDGLLRSGTPVYIITPGLYTYDPGQSFSSMMISHYQLIPVGERTVEEWYRAGIYPEFSEYTLYRILPKN